MNQNKEFKHFFEGKLSKAEAEIFSAWLNTEEGKLFLEAKLEADWNQENTEKYADWDKDALLDKINKKKQETQEGFEKSKTDLKIRIYPSKPVISYWYKVAAILIVILGAPFIFYKINSTDRISVESPSETKLITRTNPAGVKSKFQLPDGSLVTLNSESTVYYQEDFVSNRKIELLGEAYFTVAKDSVHPFVVESKGLKTRALGTVFNIKAYADERKVEVLLVEGKVMVNNINAADSVFLAPGEKVSLKSENSELVKTKGNVSMETQWTGGILEFRELEFQDIFKELERWYGVKIEVRGKISKAKGSGKFKEGESLENVLNVLSYSNSFTYEINKHIVSIGFNED